MTLNPPFCSKHTTQKKVWVCLDKNCESRLFCSHCVIFDHKKIHTEYREINTLLEDPMVSLFPSSKFNDLNIEMSFEERIFEFLKKEEKKLNTKLDEIISNLAKRFEEIKNEFHEIMSIFISQNSDTFKKLDEHRKEYQALCNNIFHEEYLLSEDKLNEKLTSIISKFDLDSPLYKSFQSCLEALPEIIPYDHPFFISLNKPSFSDLNYENFTTKKFDVTKTDAIAPLIEKRASFHEKDVNENLPQNQFWSFVPQDFKDNFEFLNENLTLSIKAIPHNYTVLGSKEFSKDFHLWNISMDINQSQWFCFGILEINGSFNPKEIKIEETLCVSSAKQVHNLNKIKGDISNGIEVGDILEFTLDFDNDIFCVKNAELFEYSCSNIKGKKYFPFISFSNTNGTSQITLYF